MLLSLVWTFSCCCCFFNCCERLFKVGLFLHLPCLRYSILVTVSSSDTHHQVTLGQHPMLLQKLCWAFNLVNVVVRFIVHHKITALIGQFQKPVVWRGSTGKKIHSISLSACSCNSHLSCWIQQWIAEKRAIFKSKNVLSLRLSDWDDVCCACVLPVRPLWFLRSSTV